MTAAPPSPLAAPRADHPPAPRADQAAGLRSLVSSLQSAPAPPFAVPSSSVRNNASTASVGRAKLITIASGKGGVGKTNIAVNLAIALAARGHRIVLLDADLGTANADVLCGLTPRARINLAQLDARALASLAIDAPGNFKLIPGSCGIPAATPGPDQLTSLITAIHGAAHALSAGTLIVDAAAGIGDEVRALVSAADLALIVTTPEPTALADAYSLIKSIALGDKGASLFINSSLIVNQARSASEAGAIHTRLSSVCERFLGKPLPYAGWIAHDPRVAAAVRARTPVSILTPRARAPRQIRALAAEIESILNIALPIKQDPARVRRWGCLAPPARASNVHADRTSRLLAKSAG